MIWYLLGIITGLIVNRVLYIIRDFIANKNYKLELEILERERSKDEEDEA